MPTFATPSDVQVEDLVHDLPLFVDLEQREQFGKPVPGRVVSFEPTTAIAPQILMLAIRAWVSVAGPF